MTSPSDDTKLSNTTLNRLPASVHRPAYDRTAVTPGIVHIGIGAFSRAHLCVYTEERIAAGETSWGLIGVDPMGPALRDVLRAQDGLYTLVVREAKGDAPRVVGSIVGAYCLPNDTQEILARMADPATRIVTITVSEKGYCQDAATGNLDEKHPLIAADLANPTAPRSEPGLITEALARRRAAGVPPFTVLSCDNLSENGHKAHRIITRFATVRDAALGAWIEKNVTFPCTMVDRITPATTDAVRADAAQLIGMEDGWPVVSEPFIQWVVEDNFTLGRPAWEKAGATMVKDVVPFEMMKLRCLNGSHSALAYLGTLLDRETVYDAMSDRLCNAFVHRLWTEDLVPTVPAIPGVDVPDYTRQLEERFLNPRIRHLTIQISSDGSQKLPPRLLEPALERLKAGAEPRCVAFLVAAWMRFLSEKSESGRAYKVADPLAAKLTAIAAEKHGAVALAEALFGISDIFTPELLAFEGFRKDVLTSLESILSLGTAKALEKFLGA